MDEIGHVNRCGGIPMYPEEYHFEFDESLFSQEELDAIERDIENFLKKI